MEKLPISSKKFMSEVMGGGNCTYSYWYEPTDEVMYESRGSLGLLISLIGPDDFPGERACKFMWDSFCEGYYYSEGSPTDAMRNAVKAAQRRLMDLIRHEEVVSEQGVDLHMCSFSFHGSRGWCPRSEIRG